MCNPEDIPKEFKLIDRYWKASNYLAVGQVRLHQKHVLIGQVEFPYVSH